jgi:hypothetical protein
MTCQNEYKLAFIYPPWCRFWILLWLLFDRPHKSFWERLIRTMQLQPDSNTLLRQLFSCTIHQKNIIVILVFLKFLNNNLCSPLTHIKCHLLFESFIFRSVAEVPDSLDKQYTFFDWASNVIVLTFHLFGYWKKLS